MNTRLEWLWIRFCFTLMCVGTFLAGASVAFAQEAQQAAQATAAAGVDPALKTMLIASLVSNLCSLIASVLPADSAAGKFFHFLALNWGKR